MQTRNTMDTGILSSAYDRAVHLSSDLMTGFYTPSCNKAQQEVKTAGTISRLATSAFALGAVNAMPASPALAIGLLYAASITGIITYVLVGERGRDARLGNPSPY